MFRQKRSDTRVDTVESQYGIELNARGDMLLGNLLDERGFDSLTQLLTAYRGELFYHARKRRLFMSFHAEDRKQVNTFRKLARDPAVEVEFYDGSLQEAVNSERSEYIKKILRKKISRASVAICLIGNGTGWRDWVDWELGCALRLRKGICGIRLPNVDAGLKRQQFRRCCSQSGLVESRGRRSQRGWMDP